VSLLSVLSNGELPLAVRVNDPSITYRTTFERKPTLKQALIRFGRGQRAVKEVEAIKNVSFQVRTGTAMGIIGSNGSGKSTLMREWLASCRPSAVLSRSGVALALCWRSGSGSTTTFPGGRTSSWAGWLPANPAARLRAAPTRSRNGPSLATSSTCP
jgi:hypothetical protein